MHVRHGAFQHHGGFILDLREFHLEPAGAVLEISFGTYDVREQLRWGDLGPHNQWCHLHLRRN
jgi:hypothetical protein